MQVMKVKAYTEMPNAYTGIVEHVDGTKTWFLNGKHHREDGPAIEFPDGTKWWKLNGAQHRVGGPAVEDASGYKAWYLNGKWHREDGPAVEWADGDKQWWLNDKLLFWLPSKSQPFILLEEFVDEEQEERIKVLTQKGVEIWKSVPGLKEFAENWEKK